MIFLVLAFWRTWTIELHPDLYGWKVFCGSGPDHFLAFFFLGDAILGLEVIAPHLSLTPACWILPESQIVEAYRNHFRNSNETGDGFLDALLRLERSTSGTCGHTPLLIFLFSSKKNNLEWIMAMYILAKWFKRNMFSNSQGLYILNKFQEVKTTPNGLYIVDLLPTI